VDLNRAEREQMLRVPGLGVRSVDGLIDLRRHKRLRLEDVKRLSRGLKASLPFIVVDDWRPTALADRANLPPAAEQLSLF
jgi:predicted DNA-binding helix-hairpin-helix protein